RRLHRDRARPGLPAGGARAGRRRRRMRGTAASGSLRLRLLAGTLAWVLLTVALAGWGLRSLFREHIAQQLQAQLVLQLDALSGNVDWDEDRQQPRVALLSDARLGQPLSGL